MSANLSLPTVSNSQLGKTVTINDIFAKLDAAMTEVISVTVGAGPATVTPAQAKAAAVILLTGQTAAATVNLPAIKRLYAVSSNSANVGVTTLTVGTGTIALAVGTTILVATDGTTNGLKQVGGASGGVALTSLTDVSVTEGAGIDGYRLTWVQSAGKWQAVAPTAGITALAGLTDVNVTEGAGINGYTLNWNQSTGKWVATAPVTGGGGGTTLAALTDVNVTEGSGINGYTLNWNQSTGKWIATAPVTGGSGGSTSSTAHRWWRLNIRTGGDNSNTSGSINVAEISMRTTTGGSQAATGGTAFASDDDGTNHAANAFDGSSSTNWITFSGTFPHQIGYHFPTAVQIVELAIQNVSSFSYYDACLRDYDMQWSDDSTTGLDGTWTNAWSAKAGQWTAQSMTQVLTGGSPYDTADARAYSIVKPTLASFANTYKTGASLAAVPTTRGVYMNQAVSANNNQIALVNNLPSTPYTVRAWGRFIGIPGNFCGWGLGHLDSSNAKNTMFMIASSSSTGNRFDVQDSSALGTYSADTSYAALASSPDPSSPIWLKLQDDGTSFMYFFSQDGEHWTKLATRGRTAYLTPTQVGVLLNVAQPNIAGIEVGAHIFSYDVTAGLN